MEDWTRVLLYGTYDGFTYSTDDLPRIVVVLDGGERVEVPKECVISEDQMVNKNKIKLKDVIARIKSFDVGAKEVWLNEILNELGSDYGTLKYKAGYDQGKFEGEWFGKQLEEADKVRQELNEPVVNQFVADWYEEHKDDLEYRVWECIYHDGEGKQTEMSEWICQNENAIITLVNMHQFGYEVEKEKRYYVRFKGMESDDFNYLNFIKFQHAWVLSSIKLDKKFRTEHTKKQLEDAGFGWVFDCEGIELEEVE